MHSFPSNNAHKKGTCWHEFEDSSSTITQSWNLELTTQVRQLEKEGCVPGILSHDLQHKVPNNEQR